LLGDHHKKITTKSSIALALLDRQLIVGRVSHLMRLLPVLVLGFIYRAAALGEFNDEHLVKEVRERLFVLRLSSIA
jgi:hypothetical protein